MLSFCRYLISMIAFKFQTNTKQYTFHSKEYNFMESTTLKLKQTTTQTQLGILTGFSICLGINQLN